MHGGYIAARTKTPTFATQYNHARRGIGLDLFYGIKQGSSHDTVERIQAVRAIQRQGDDGTMLFRSD
jgi:hypothetical protein